MLSRASQLSLGIPMGCLATETSGLVIPGALEVFTFSQHGKSAPSDTGASTSAGLDAATIGQARQAHEKTSQDVLPDVLPDEERRRLEEHARLTLEIGSYFTNRLQMKLRLDHHLTMVAGSSVKPKHIKIQHVESDGFCLIRAIQQPHEMSQTEMRDIVRRLVTTSLQTPRAFMDRVVSLSDALHTYTTCVQRGVPTWVFSLSEDLSKLQEKDDLLLRELAYMSKETEERAKWETRIIEACTRNKDDTSSKDGAGLLLWLCESEICRLADELGVAVRCWQTTWSEITDQAGAVEYEVDEYSLVAVFHPTHGGALPLTSPCLDIVHSEDHFDRMTFIQERFHALQLDVRDWPPLGKDRRARLKGSLSELAILLGSTVPSNIVAGLDGADTGGLD
eukprot:3229365-Prymnesium_polylepis.1